MSQYRASWAQPYLRACLENNWNPTTSVDMWMNIQRQSSSEQQSIDTTVPHNSPATAYSHPVHRTFLLPPLRKPVRPRVHARHTPIDLFRLFVNNADLAFKARDRLQVGSFILETSEIFQEVIGGLSTGECEPEEEQGNRKVHGFTWNKFGRRVTHYEGSLPSSTTNSSTTPKPLNPSITPSPAKRVTRRASGIPPITTAKRMPLLTLASEKTSQTKNQAQNEKSSRTHDLLRTWDFFCPACAIFEQNFDDGKRSIACNKCNVWTHSKCHKITKAIADKRDFVFICVRCRPGAVRSDSNSGSAASSSTPLIRDTRQTQLNKRKRSQEASVGAEQRSNVLSSSSKSLLRNTRRNHSTR